MKTTSFKAVCSQCSKRKKLWGVDWDNGDPWCWKCGKAQIGDLVRNARASASARTLEQRKQRLVRLQRERGRAQVEAKQEAVRGAENVRAKAASEKAHKARRIGKQLGLEGNIPLMKRLLTHGKSEGDIHKIFSLRYAGQSRTESWISARIRTYKRIAEKG